MHAFYRGRWWSRPEPCVGIADSANRGTQSRKKQCLTESHAGVLGGFNWSTQHLDISEVCDGVREAAVGGSWLSGSDSLAGTADGGLAAGPGPGLGGGCCGGDDRECSRRCRRVAAGWFSGVPPCWRRESTTARDGFGVATCPQMSAERISSPSDCASTATRDAVACARSRRISACAATASSSVIIASFGGGPGGPNRPESSPHGSPKVRRRLPWSSNDLAVHQESA